MKTIPIFAILAKPNINLIAIGLFSVTLFLVTDSRAQTVNQTLPEVVVTASRVETLIEQVGSAITVITREQLENSQTQFVSEALRQVSGVSVNRTGVIGSVTEVRIRGAEANHTLVLIDGIEVNDPTLGSSFDFAHLLTADVERIEILRGSQSALWGSDAIGGVINIITRKGSGALTGTASLEGGSFDTYQLNAGLSGGSDRYHYALSGARFDTDGDSIAPTGEEDDGYENTTLSFKTGVTPLDNLSFDLVGRYTSAESETDPQDFSDLDAATFGQLIDGDQVGEVDQFYGRAQAKLTLLDGAWEHTLGAAITDTENEFFTDGIRTNRTEGKRIKYDYQSNFLLDTPDFAQAYHTLIFVIEREEEDFSQRGETPGAPQNQDQDMTNTGFVGEYRVGLWDQWFLSGALRYDNNDRFEDETTYRLTGAYLYPTWQTRLHTSYGTGVKNPSFTELFGFFPDSFVGNPDLEPEKSESWDIGIEQHLLDKRLVFDITYFHNDFEDEIVSTFDPDTFLSSVENSPDTSRRRGVEVTLRAQVQQNVNLRGSYTYLSSEDAEGLDEVRRPKHTASLDVNYRLLDDRANLNLVIDYVGEQEDFNFTTIPTSRVTLDDFTLVNFSGAYRLTKHFEIFGRIDNLLDENYQEVFGHATLGRGYYLGFKAAL